MIERAQHKAKVAPIGSPDTADETLPYRIELWGAANREIERVLAHAFNAALARAIFKAARGEHPDRRITLRRGSRIVADSAE
jgi:hypothetical protein